MGCGGSKPQYYSPKQKVHPNRYHAFTSQRKIHLSVLNLTINSFLFNVEPIYDSTFVTAARSSSVSYTATTSISATTPISAAASISTAAAYDAATV